MAVPKKKTSPSRRRMRSASKHVRFDTMTACAHCGSMRRPHHMCTHCGFYNGRQVCMTRRQKRQERAKQENQA